MKVLIIGSGAMGSLFAGKLKANGVDVTVFNRPNPHVTAIHNNGLTIIDKDDLSTKIELTITTDASKLNRNYDIIILFVKTFATEVVLEHVIRHVDQKTPILTLQNGIGNKERIHHIAPQRDVFIGGTYAGASIKKPGVVLHQAWGKTFIGPTELKHDGILLQEIASVFTKSGLMSEVSTEVESIIWSKLLVNVAYNGLTAMTRLRNGEIISIQEGRALIEKLVHEVIQIAKLKEIPLLFKDPVQECIRLGETEIGKNISSMLSDVLNERKTEIEAINGAIVEEGKRYGVQTPYNEMVMHVIRVIETSYSKQITIQ